MRRRSRKECGALFPFSAVIFISASPFPFFSSPAQRMSALLSVPRFSAWKAAEGFGSAISAVSDSLSGEHHASAHISTASCRAGVTGNGERSGFRGSAWLKEEAPKMAGLPTGLGFLPPSVNSQTSLHAPDSKNEKKSWYISLPTGFSPSNRREGREEEKPELFIHLAASAHAAAWERVGVWSGAADFAFSALGDFKSEAMERGSERRERRRSAFHSAALLAVSLSACAAADSGPVFFVTALLS